MEIIAAIETPFLQQGCYVVCRSHRGSLSRKRICARDTGLSAICSVALVETPGDSKLVGFAKEIIFRIRWPEFSSGTLISIIWSRSCGAAD
jgi:hypothetical protein